MHIEVCCLIQHMSASFRNQILAWCSFVLTNFRVVKQNIRLIFSFSITMSHIIHLTLHPDNTCVVSEGTLTISYMIHVHLKCLYNRDSGLRDLVAMVNDIVCKTGKTWALDVVVFHRAPYNLFYLQRTSTSSRNRRHRRFLRHTRVAVTYLAGPAWCPFKCSRLQSQGARV
jgi:hypothetical protein